MQVIKLSDAAGVAVEGTDLAAPRTPEQDAALMGLYDEHGLVVFRGQKLTKQQLVDAGAPFGGTQLDIPATVDDPEVKGIVVISTRGTTGEVVPEDQEALIGDLAWHADQWYVTKPNRGKILYGVQVPEEGGMTGFVDNQLTYEALSDEMKERIEGLHVVHGWDLAASYLARNKDYRIGEQLVTGKFPDVVFPLVMRHPKTGKKILNMVPLYAGEILEMPGPDGQELIDELRDHVMQPQFMYWHPYEVGDAVLWDNWRLIHASSGTPGKYVRTLWSIVIDGGPQFGPELPADKKERAKARRMALVNAQDAKETLACRICRLYLHYVKSQDVEGLWDLFPEGTRYNGPDGALLSHPDPIAAGYARGFANMGTPWKFKMERVLPFGGEHGCLLQFGHKTNEPGADFTLSAVDHIEVNDQGQITRFLPFFASTEIPRVLENINRHKTHDAAHA
jgi:taurine dioxygenase